MSEKYKIQIPDIEFWKGLVPCQIGCPIHTDAGRYVQLIAKQKYKAAYLTSRSPNPFASVCGRVCAAPCEDRCRRGKIDAPVSIRALKRFVTEKYGVESLDPDTQDGLFEGSEEAGNKWRWHLPVQIQTRKNVVKNKKAASIRFMIRTMRKCSRPIRWFWRLASKPICHLSNLRMGSSSRRADSLKLIRKL